MKRLPFAVLLLTTAHCHRDHATLKDRPDAGLSARSDDGASQKSIGTATMDHDGTIVLDLRSFDPKLGARAEAELRYPRSHAQYAEILAHVGGLKPGERKAVKPWD